MIEGWFNNRCTITTTDATETTLWIKTLDDETAYVIEAMVMAQYSDGSNCAMFLKRILVYRNEEGNATIRDSYEDPGDSECDFDLDTSGQSVRARVTGVAATSIIWLGQIKYMKIVGTA